MAGVDPGRLGNDYQAMHPQTTHPHYGDYNDPPPPKRKRIRALMRRILGRPEQKDQ